MSDFSVVKVCRFNFGISCELYLLRGAVELYLLPDDLIRTVFPCGLNADGILSGFHRLALVVLAIPSQHVLARRPGRAAYRCRDVRTFRHRSKPVVPIPRLQVWQPLRLVVPERYRTDRE